jgi:ABC-type branched-subunit amino acid transport system substrate-binding protein
MKSTKIIFSAIIIACCLGLVGIPQAMAANDFFDPGKMGVMSDFDPDNPVIPTGDTIKIAIVASFSGPAAVVGDIYFASVQSVAHDINKRGGILVDGKKKLVQVIKANHESKVPITKKVSERMVLQEKVDILWGTNGSHLMKVINQVADKYKTIAVCTAALSDELYDAKNFTRYSFMTSYSTQQIGRAVAYYYGQMRKKEKKFYILCQDYLFGHSMAEGFKDGLKEYYPDAELVGEDYHKLFLTDFAPFLTKIKASGAEVLYTGDWIPDAANLTVQARQMGLDLPFAHTFINNPPFLHEVGVEGSKGLVHVAQFGSEGEAFKNAGQIMYYKAWNNQSPKWKKPFDTTTYAHGTSTIGAYRMQTYWILSVIERAGSTDPEKIIKVWENDTWADVNGNVYKMRAIDHKAERDLFIEIYVPPEQQKENMNIEPYYWFKGCSWIGPSYRIPAEKVLPKLDPNLKAIRKGY